MMSYPTLDRFVRFLSVEAEDEEEEKGLGGNGLVGEYCFLDNIGDATARTALDIVGGREVGKLGWYLDTPEEDGATEGFSEPEWCRDRLEEEGGDTGVLGKLGWYWEVVWGEGKCLELVEVDLVFFSSLFCD